MIYSSYGQNNSMFLFYFQLMQVILKERATKTFTMLDIQVRREAFLTQKETQTILYFSEQQIFRKKQPENLKIYAEPLLPSDITLRKYWFHSLKFKIFFFWKY